MSVAENADVKVDSSGQNLDKNIVSAAQTKPPCPDDQNPKRQTSEVNLKIEISHLDDKFSKLNPMAREFVPPSLAYSASLRNGLWFTNNFAMQAISSANGIDDKMREGAFAKGSASWMNKTTSLPQSEDVIRRTVYVSDIDQQVTEEQLAGLFLSCGQVVDCRICGDQKSILRFAFIEFTDKEGASSALRLSGTVFGSHPIKVLLSKTAIAPVNPTFLPRSEDERLKCVKTVYCTNIDKKVTQMELENFFKTVCGEVQHLRLLGDDHHQTRIAFVEFTLAESAVLALNCSGVVLGRLSVRVSPSKTPVRPHRSDLN